MKQPLRNPIRAFSQVGLIGLVAGSLVLGGCGPTDGGKEATSVVMTPTLEITQGSPAPSPGASPMTQASSTPISGNIRRSGAETSTPEAESGSAVDQATPGASGSIPGQTLVPGRQRPPQAAEDDGTPLGEAETAAASDGAPVPGDGTTGAGPSRDAATPAEIASPDADVTPDSAVVESCNPEDVPEFTGDTETFVVVENLNFRTGPGVDCDPVGESLLESGASLTVTSDPVVRDGEDTEWVRVEVEGQEGWVATQFIEPEAE